MKEQQYKDIGTNINIGQHDIEIMKNFIYLSSEVTSDMNVIAEIKRLMILAGQQLLIWPSKTYEIQTHFVYKSKV